MPTLTQFLSGFTFNGQPVLKSGQVNPQAAHQSAAQSAIDRDFLLAQKKQLEEKARSELDPKNYMESAKSETNAQLNEVEEKLAGLPLGSTSPILRKYGLTDADFQYNIAPIYARLLQSAELGGGYLSPTQSSREFAAASAGAGSALASSERASMASAAQANLNPLFASRANEVREFDAMSRLFGERSRIAAEGEERRFMAMKAFADMLASTTIAQQQERTQTIAALTGADIAAKAQKKAANKAFWGNVIGGVAGGIIAR